MNCRKRKKREPKSVCNSPVDNDHVLTDLSGNNNGFQGHDYVTSGSVAKAQSAASPSTPGHIVTSGGDEYAIVDKGNDDTSLVENVEYVSDSRPRDSQDDTSLVDNVEYVSDIRSRDSQDDTSLVENVEYVSDVRSRDKQDEPSLVENSQYDTFH